MTDVVITPRGEFSLREAALFGFGHRHEKSFDGVLRMAFVLDGYQRQVGVEIRQAGSGSGHGDVLVRTVDGSAEFATAAAAQVARILSLDHDAREFEAVCRRDPVLAKLRATAPGLRPVLFHSPYEAAVWSILSARRQPGQAMALRERLARSHGRSFVLAGQPVAAVPTPRQLLGIETLPGLPDNRLAWLHGVARAALAGALDAATLATMDASVAMAGLRRLDGIGPFYAALIQVRSTGAVDVVTSAEPRLLALVERLYGDRDLLELSEAWRPYRTWASVLIRAAADRI